ncbi:hypothetical protein EGW08_016001 [Elysia chlorotica]|uniref:E3 ubiquitin-protein ligase RNF144B n=1 Tax=Elysia chlorotica TaxID=188477 RepID=A0A433T3U5_ELYCH|nr:hypothetical protein EGW08_016001 [Elysia chlorotica]
MKFVSWSHRDHMLSTMASYCVSRNSVDLTIEPLVVCKLCLDECPRRDLFQLSECKCVFCEMCMRQYVAVMIAEGMVEHITCPDAECRKQPKLTVREVQVDLDPNRTFCPEIGCETVCHVCSHRGEGAAAMAKAVQCPTCGLQFCSICKSKWHGEQKLSSVVIICRPYFFFSIPFANNEDAKIKRCPVCHVPIERNDGCAQMLCKQCKHCFCWYCLQSLDDDFLLRHYDKGPCKNKLGHSRASVIWHRTQVVGIFAGFGVLLLVASPFLLLAAPCILCCKCNICQCCEEDDT